MKFKDSILVFRFSAMGDVAMSAAVIREFALQNPNLRIIMVTRAAFFPFFRDIPSLVFHPLDPKAAHKGLRGLYKLYQELRQYQPIALADLHHNLRSRILCSFFRMQGIRISKLDKNRQQKKLLTRKANKKRLVLRPVVQAYADVFNRLGFPLILPNRFSKQEKALPEAYEKFFKDDQRAHIGIAPFAQHAQKVYPLEKMEEVVRALSEQGHRLYLFGGGLSEKQVAEQWASAYPNVESLIGKINLTQELDLISHLDLMLSMDSAGMHMASLMGIRVVSIWGATHPDAGFLGYGQQKEDAILLNLPCQPCSVYGNKPCYRGDFACMRGINSGIIIARINESLLKLPK